MKLVFRHITSLVTLAMLLLCSCDSSYSDGLMAEAESNDDMQYDSDDTNSTLTKGFDSFAISIPILDRFQDFVAENVGVSTQIDIYMRGRTITDLTVLEAELSVDSDMLILSSTDSEALAELYHQEYFVNYIAVHNPTRSSSDDSVPEDSITIGALLSATDPDNIYFLTSFSANSSINGSGSSIYDPYIITSAADYKSAVVDELNSGNSLLGKYFLQSNDINFNEISDPESYTCAGSRSLADFEGHYDGGMMKISQLNIGDTLTSDVAMFYALGCNGVICNWIFQNISVTAYSNGAIVAAKCYEGEITHVFLESGCSVTVDDSCGGGFVGYGTGGKIVSCSSKVSVKGDTNCGGFWGSADSTSGVDSTISIVGESTFNGNIDVSDGKAGGLIGNIKDVDNVVIDDVTVAGTINSSSGKNIYYIGGLIGYMYNFKSCSISNAKISSTRDYNDYYVYTSSYDGIAFNIDADSYVGGLIGYAHGSSQTTLSSELTITSSSMAYSGDQTFEADGYLGGCIGYSSYVIFKDCDYTNNADIDGGEYVGGFCGYYTDSIFEGSSTLCNNGNIYGSSSYIGGLIGYMTDHSAYNSTGTVVLENHGNVTSALDCIGGCIGKINLDQSSNSFIYYKNYGSVTGNDYVGGFCGSADSLSPSLYAVKETDVHYNGWGGSENVIISGDCYVGGLFGSFSSASGLTYNIYGKSKAIVVGNEYTGGVAGTVGVVPLNTTISCLDTDSEMTINGGNYTGGVVGILYGYSSGTYTFDQIDYLSDISTISGGTGVGGILGYLGDTGLGTDCEFLKCVNRAKISASNTGCGGILGISYLNSSSADLTFTQCANWGSIISSASNSKAGGILGYSDLGGEVHLNECANGGSLSGSDNRGGLVGSSDQYLHIDNCYNSGVVDKGGTNVAGLVGSVPSSGNNNKIAMVNSYNSGVSGYGTLGGDEDLGNGDISSDGVDKLYYYGSAVDGELDFGHLDSTKLSKSQMTDGSTMNLSTTYWVRPSDGSSLPYLKNIPNYHGNYPKL